MEIRSGNNSSFWFDNWLSPGRLIDLTGPRGCNDMGININATVGYAVQSYRPRRRRGEQLKATETKIMDLRAQGLLFEENLQLWKG